MDMQELGFYLYMEEQEKQQKDKEVNAELKMLMERELPTQNHNER